MRSAASTVPSTIFRASGLKNGLCTSKNSATVSGVAGTGCEICASADTASVHARIAAAALRPTLDANRIAMEQASLPEPTTMDNGPARVFIHEGTFAPEVAGLCQMN